MISFKITAKKLSCYTAKQQDAILALVAAVAPLVLFFDVMLGKSVLFNKDIQLSFYPLKTYFRQRILQGEFPLWTPDLGLGMPFFALPEAGVLYPLNAILLLPWPACVSRLLVVHLALASIGMYFLARNLKMGPVASAFGALAYSMGGYVVSMASSSGLYVISASWMPLVVFLARRVAIRADLRSIGYLSLAGACQILSGEIQGCLLTAVVAALFSLDAPKKIRALLRLSLGAAMSLLISLPQIVSTISFMGATQRSLGTTYKEATGLSLHPLRMIEIVISGFLGDISSRVDYLGFYMNRIGSDSVLSPWSDSVYLGSIAVVFVILSILRKKSKSDKIQIITAAIGLCALVLAFGDSTPLYYLCYKLFPLAHLFRYPEKLFMLTSFSAALLAAHGLHKWLESSKIENLKLFFIWIFICAAVFAVFLLAPIMGNHFAIKQSWTTPNKATAIVRSACGIELSVLIVSGAIIYLTSRFYKEYKGIAVLMCLIVQLVLMNRGIVQTAPGSFYSNNNLTAETLAARAGKDMPKRLLNSPFSPVVYSRCLANNDNLENAILKQIILQPNTGLMYGVTSYHSYVGMTPASAKRFWKETKDIHREIMDLVSIPFGIFPLDEKTNQDSTLERILDDKYPCLGMYKSNTTLPIARPVSKALEGRNIDDSLVKLRQPDVLNGKTAIIEGIHKLWTSKSSANAGDIGRCISTTLNNKGAVVRCTLKEDAWVVINVAYNASMKAYLDGAETELKPALGIVSAVWTPQGDHSIKIEYREKHIVWTTAISLIALLSCLAITIRRHP